jgi:hypothetical protein
MRLRQAKNNSLYSGKRDTRADWCAEFITNIAERVQSRWSWTKARAALAANPAKNLAGYRTSALRVTQRGSFA